MMSRLVKLVLLSTLLLSANISAQQKVVAVIDGEPVYMADIMKGSEQEIFKAEKALYDLKYANLRQLMVSKMIASDPKSKGMSENDYLGRYVVAKKEFGEKEINDFIAKRRIPANKVTASLKQQVKRYLTGQHIANEIDKWLTQVSKDHQITINLQPPEEPRFAAYTDLSPVRGNKNAKVTIVEYSDFECPFCTKANTTLHQLAKIYGDKIKLVYKHLPLAALHANAHNLALAGVCAQDQSEAYFWQLHDKIFENNRGLTLGKVKDYVKKFGLNMDKFNQCLSAPETASRVDNEMHEAERFGFNATPAFLINGRVLQGAQDIEVFKKIINEELASN